MDTSLQTGMNCVWCGVWFDFKKPRSIPRVIQEIEVWREPLFISEPNDDYMRRRVKRAKLRVNGLPIQVVGGSFCVDCRRSLEKCVQKYQISRGIRRKKLIPKPPPTPGQEAYTKYLGTTYWGKVREAKFAQDGKMCAYCGSMDKLQVHHRNYAHRGSELEHLEDLVVSCNKCHIKKHKIIAFPQKVKVKA